jgi:nucleoside-diphosphate-sugar epimerase
VVTLSSIEVYGRPLSLPVAEDHPTDPFTSYGVAKLCAEHYLGIWCAKHRSSFAALRVAFIYGPGQHAKNVIPRFLAAARRGEPPTVFGTGADVRDDVFVDDVAEAAGLALVNAAEGVFNVASGRPHTLLEVAEAVCAVAGRELRPVVQPAASGWVDRWYSFDRARKVLGCSEPRSFADGIAAMWQAVPS